MALDQAIANERDGLVDFVERSRAGGGPVAGQPIEAITESSPGGLGRAEGLGDPGTRLASEELLTQDQESHSQAQSVIIRDGRQGDRRETAAGPGPSMASIARRAASMIVMSSVPPEAGFVVLVETVISRGSRNTAASSSICVCTFFHSSRTAAGSLDREIDWSILDASDRKGRKDRHDVAILGLTRNDGDEPGAS